MPLETSSTTPPDDSSLIWSRLGASALLNSWVPEPRVALVVGFRKWLGGPSPNPTHLHRRIPHKGQVSLSPNISAGKPGPVTVFTGTNIYWSLYDMILVVGRYGGDSTWLETTQLQSRLLYIRCFCFILYSISHNALCTTARWPYLIEISWMN